ncbi:receptor-like protein 7 [Syzygium oleosum]|uniref:receptor-like protein 7 n=1 Tax=Syzygium oleosum TaxID=219896 RepID=UPI0011D24A2F|nr:receptor-like protein 7 [Syzygium oleosum]
MRIWLLLWLVLILVHANPFSIGTVLVSGQCLSDQKSLLLELHNSLKFNASLSSKLIKWNQSNDSWDGVTCEGGQVTGLDLSNESITSGLNDSSSLFRLNYLQRLNLAYNSFQSLEIPSGFGNLTNLVYLNLSNAGFTGQVPIGISRLTRLVTLDISLLYFPGLASLKLENPNLKMLVGNLSELRELHLDGVNVSATGNELCNSLSSSLPKLQVLSMIYCSLSGPIESCSSLVNLRFLSVIKLSSNNLSTTVPEFFAHFYNLTSLHLSNCGLQGEFPQKIFQVQTLQTLDLSFNRLLQGYLPEFPENGSFQTLSLSFTNISGRLPDSIGNLRNLSTIELENCSFTGPIPSSIAKLSLLAFLDFSFNQFSGPVPPFGISKNLARIRLSHNALTGQIFSVGWVNLLNLVNLDLQNNLLEGDIPPALFTLPRLTMIQLSHNRFSGQLIIYSNVSSDQLLMLDLGSNQLQGSIPVSIFKLQGLRELSLSFNNFSGSMNIDALQGFGNLTRLDLSYNGLSINAMASASSAAASSFPDFKSLKLASCQLRTLPHFLANQSKLVSLDLSHNYIHGEIPRWIWTLEDLVHLNLSFNFFKHLETPLRNITSALSVVDLHSNMLRGKMPPLPSYIIYLDFSSNNINSVIPDDIGDYLSVTMFFSLSKNNIYGSIPKSICKADHYLEVLDLSHNHLNGTIPDCLMMEALKVLNLRNNQLNGDIPQSIPGTCDLKTLDISENLLQGQIPLSLANCTTLEVVNIGDNQIDGTFPCHFKAISTLRVLVLRSNRLHGKIGCSSSNGTWHMLQIIDLSSNDFSGTLPVSLLASCEAMKANRDFNHLQYQFLPLSGLNYQDTMSVTLKGLQLELVKILTVFTSIDFSGNRLEGPIPDTLGDLQALYFLNLSHNDISGSIPPVLGNLHQLESLDLSWNFLNGTIPDQLENLDFLSFLNLSKNQLVGSIPASRQFLTFPKSSFEGNLGLCGFLLNKNCSITTDGLEEAGDDGDNDDSEKKWFYMGLPLGFVVGFWAFFGPLMFNRSWRFAYYRFWDKVLLRHSHP